MNGLAHRSPVRSAERRTASRPALPPGSMHSWLWVIPAFLVYAGFALYPLAETIWYSFLNWDGIGAAHWVGLGNYKKVFTDPNLFGSIVHAFILIVFFTAIPVFLGLLTSQLLRDIRSSAFNRITRTLLFLPQIVPLAGAAIAWSWMYSSNGAINQALRLVGLGSLARPWLGDFTFALPAVGFIGSWVAFGLCTVLFSAGIGKIDRSLYEAARIDGAGRAREFVAVTLPGLRNEIVVALTVLTIAALASFDIIYVATAGGPGFQTMVPGVLIYRLTFTTQQVGLASALGVVLALLVVCVIAPLQGLARSRTDQ